MTMNVLRGHAISNIRPAILALATLFGILALHPAQAEIVSISGAAFFQQCPCAPSGNIPTLDRGVLKPTDFSKVYASVSFPPGAQRICSFSVVYQDINGAENLTARLFRKTFTLGGNAFAQPVAVATVSSANGVVPQVRKATTTAISLPGVSKSDSFYYAEVTFPTINLGLLGVQIDVRPSCPAP